MDSILKIVLISPFQNKTGLSGNTSMFQITVRETTLVTCSHERAPGPPRPVAVKFSSAERAEHDSALSLPISERGAGARLRPAKDHSKHMAATGPGTLSVSSPVCFRWESSGDTSPGFPNTEGWSMSNRKGFSFLSVSGELHAQTCSKFQAPGF